MTGKPVLAQIKSILYLSNGIGCSSAYEIIINIFVIAGSKIGKVLTPYHCCRILICQSVRRNGYSNNPEFS